MASSAQTGDPASESFATRVLQTGLLLDKVYTPILCLFGALGNSLSLAVFCMDSKYRSQSSSYYLSALAVSDTGFLLNLFAVWLESVHGGVITSDLMCPLVMYLGQVTCFISIYLMVAFSIERYVAVHYPFSRPRICTKSKAKKGILAVATVAMLLFSYAWIIAQVIEVSPTPQVSQSVGNGSGAINENVETDWPHDNFTIQLNEINFTEEETGVNLAKIDKDTRELRPLLALEKEQKHEHIDSSQHEKERKNTFSLGNDLSQNVINRRNEDSGKLLNVDKSRNRSIKLTQVERPDMAEHMMMIHSKWDYFHLDDEGKERPTQQRLKTNKMDDDPVLFSSGSPHGNFGNNETASAKLGNMLKSTTTATAAFQKEKQTMGKREHDADDWRRRHRCSVPKRYYKISEVANYLDTAVTLIIPFLLITYLNVRIAVSVWKLRDQRQHIVASPLPKNSTRIKATLVVTDNRHGKHSPVTKVVDTGLLHPHYHLEGSRIAGRNKRSNSTTSEGDTQENGACHWQQQLPREASVRFEDANSSGSDRYNVTCREENMVIAENNQVLLETPKPILRNGNDGVKRDFSFFNRGSKTAYQQHHHQSSSEARVTKLLLLISTVFLVLNLPLHAIRCTQFIQSVTGTKEGKDILLALQPWANLLFNTNFAVNFLLYCASGRNFRKSLKHITSRVLRTLPQQQQQLSLPTTTSHHQDESKQDSRLKRNWKRGKNSAPEERAPRTIRANSNCSTSFVREHHATELLEMDEMVGLDVIEDSAMCLNTNGNDENKTV